MSRSFHINGESLVRVKFGLHLISGAIPFSGSAPISLASGCTVYELGLAEEAVTIVPHFRHQDVHADDFGPHIPAEVLAQLSDCTIHMKLIHYDRNVLDACMGEALGGTSPNTPAGAVLGPTNQPLGAGHTLGSSGCHYVSLNILSPVENVPWRFPASYLPALPLEMPLGTEKTVVDLVFRAIPYVSPYSTYQSQGRGTIFIPQEIASSGARLWDHTLDT